MKTSYNHRKKSKTYSSNLVDSVDVSDLVIEVWALWRVDWLKENEKYIGAIINHDNKRYAVRWKSTLQFDEGFVPKEMRDDWIGDYRIFTPPLFITSHIKPKELISKFALSKFEVSSQIPETLFRLHHLANE